MKKTIKYAYLNMSNKYLFISISFHSILWLYTGILIRIQFIPMRNQGFQKPIWRLQTD